jgi:hypothetical protein
MSLSFAKPKLLPHWQTFLLLDPCQGLTQSTPSYMTIRTNFASRRTQTSAESKARAPQEN